MDGWVSDVAVCAVTREPDGKCSAHGRFCPVVRMASEADTRANATQAFHDGLDGWGIRAPTVFEYEALRADWEKNHKPSPAENARRYSKEGGMW